MQNAQAGRVEGRGAFEDKRGKTSLISNVWIKNVGGLTHLFIFFFNVITNTPEMTSGEKKTSLRLVHSPKTAHIPLWLRS